MVKRDALAILVKFCKVMYSLMQNCKILQILLVFGVSSDNGPQVQPYQALIQNH